MNEQPYLGMRAGDLDDKPYARHWQPDMGRLSADATGAVLEGPVAAELGFSHRHSSLLLEPGYLPIETGYTRLHNGQVFVAVLTPMPGVTGQMVDWWFGWHGGESQRYKLWHPRAHASVKNRDDLSDRVDLSDREKYVGNVSYVKEYIGYDFLPISIAFNSPADNHLDDSRFAEAGVSTAICARAGFTNKPINFSRLIHLIRNTENGCEMRSRFWLGDLALRNMAENSLLNRTLRSTSIARRAGSLSLGRDLLVHCAMEMRHLASFLPALYQDYHPGTTGIESHTVTQQSLPEQVTSGP